MAADDNTKADILGVNNKPIEESLTLITQKLDKMSQALFRMAEDSYTHSGKYVRDNTVVSKPDRGRRAYDDWGSGYSDHSRNPQVQAGRRIVKGINDFVDEFEWQLTDALVTSHFRNKVGSIFNNIAEQTGISFKDASERFNKRLAGHALEAFKSTKIGQRISDTITSRSDNLRERVLSNASQLAAQASTNKLQGSVVDLKAKVNGGEELNAIDQKRLDTLLSTTNMSQEQFATSSVKDILSTLQSSLADKYKSTLGKSNKPEDSESNESDYDKRVNRIAQLAQDRAKIEAEGVDTKSIFEQYQSTLNTPTDPVEITSHIMNDVSVIRMILEKLEDEEGYKDRLTKEADKLGVDNIEDLEQLKRGNITDPEEFKQLFEGSDLYNDASKAATDAAIKSIDAEQASLIEGDPIAQLLSGKGDLAATAFDAIDIAADKAAEALSGIGVAAPMVGLAVLAFKAGLKLAVKVLGDDLKEITKAFDETMSNALNSFLRSTKSATKATEEANKRREFDVKTLVETPFKILENAAQKVYDAWDSNLQLINATQGYTKSNLQDLMAVYADRLRSEGLTDVIAGTSIIENLTKVLNSGLSGAIAEEFAYQATLLNAAIPTQDFFGYASTYSSIVANAVKDGEAQSEAIEKANASLTEFANNLLYASREVAGGYSTGLTNAQSLYEQAVRVAQAANSENISEISGTFAAVAATIGAIAPDLSTSITDAIYKAATGGNDSTIVALRSLAGINASNTEFLRALAEDPQSVFSTLFSTLAAMFNDSADAYMEKAEGYAQLFGLSAEAFQRIDFAYLADTISNMNVNSKSLDANMELLASGQTTLTEEQLKNREINKMMIEEGLSYVLDNAATRAIQQHLWDEQLALQMQEATYGVELVGSSAKLLTSLNNLGENLMKLFNPFAAIGGIVDLIKTAEEGSEVDDRVKKWLEASNVGKANSEVLNQLTTYGKNFNLVGDALTEMNKSGVGGSFDLAGDIIGKVKNMMLKNDDIDNPNSAYRWNMVSKSMSDASKSILTALQSVDIALPAVAQSTKSATSAIQSALTNKIETMLSDEYLAQYLNIENPKSYEDWANDARRRGIADVSKALEEAGYTEDTVKSYFESKQAQAAGQEKQRLQVLEEKFWSHSLTFLDEYFPNDFQEPLFTSIEIIEDYAATMIDNQSLIIDLTDSSNKLLQEHVKNFADYFIRHRYYDASGYKYSDVVEIQKKEKDGTGDAIYALAESLTQNAVDLKDPTVQTNAILSQILIVLNAIMQQNNTTNTPLSLQDSFTGLATRGYTT